MNSQMESKAVDMVEQARMAQTVDSRLEPGEIRLIAPAKVNLFLDIGDKRHIELFDICTACLDVLKVPHGKPCYVATRFFKRFKLSGRCLRIRSIRVRHGLHGYGATAAYRYSSRFYRSFDQL